VFYSDALFKEINTYQVCGHHSAKYNGSTTGGQMPLCPFVYTFVAVGAVRVDTVCSMPETNPLHSGMPMFDSHATVRQTVHQNADLRGELVSLLLPTTPPKPVVIEVWCRVTC